METAVCKKCQRPHRIEVYRAVKYYVCPEVNRVLLLNDEGETDVTKTNRYDPADAGEVI